LRLYHTEGLRQIREILRAQGEPQS
jgi:hypothetical protein